MEIREKELSIIGRDTGEKRLLARLNCGCEISTLIEAAQKPAVESWMSGTLNQNTGYNYLEDHDVFLKAGLH